MLLLINETLSNVVVVDDGKYVMNLLSYSCNSFSRMSSSVNKHSNLVLNSLRVLRISSSIFFTFVRMLFVVALERDLLWK